MKCKKMLISRCSLMTYLNIFIQYMEALTLEDTVLNLQIHILQLVKTHCQHLLQCKKLKPNQRMINHFQVA